MEIIIHRVNTINELRDIPINYGTEIDIRSYGSNLILNHEPFQFGEDFEDYIGEYKHGTLVLNIKEAGIEEEVLRLVRKNSQIKNYFLLDVEFPHIYEATRNGEKAIALRFSEDESLDTVINYVDKVNWVWIDTNTILPLDEINLPILNRFKKCLVCPERWGRSFDIEKYKEIMIGSFNFNVDAVMTGYKYAKKWKE